MIRTAIRATGGEPSAPAEDGDRADPADRIRLVVASIPAGRVSTYGRVAELADLPRRARLVGRILARLPAGSRLPWHRVVAAGGRIATRGGRSRDGSDDSGAGLQYQRLRAEDVPFRGERVDLRRCGWPDPESP
jgi:methylated-DNA-protein-cysteine methyltransferase-like protein